MILAKSYFFILMLIQQVPPPPPDGTQRRGPTPPGDVIPVDTNLWILMAIAIAIIVRVTLPRLKKAS